MAKLFTYKFYIASFAIAVVYVILTIYLMNFRLVRDTIIGDFPLGYKSKLLFELLQGMWTSMTEKGILLLITTAILTGVNLSLLVGRLKELKSQGNVRLVVGGSSLLGIVGSGCAACGLPILALLGLSGGVAFLPLRGTELSYLSVVLLLVSFYILTRTATQQSCNINTSKRSYE